MSPMINFYRRPETITREWVISSWLRMVALAPKQHKTSPLLTWVSGAVFILSLIGTLSFFFPDLYHSLTPFDPQPIAASVDSSALGGDWEDGTLYATIELPPRDENLPEGNWLIIQKTGVRTLIDENPEEQLEESLAKGVWRAPDFGSPMEYGHPMILVAHRFGYLRWSNAYRRQHSFYNLDKLEIGDTFDVIWEQRRFTYEIYAGEEAEHVSDYSADVILYTCKHLNSPIRIFRYARRVEY